MCHMIVDCCGQNRTYEKFFGLTATRLCMLKREYMELFELIFVEQYETIHRLETNKLRNVAKVRCLTSALPVLSHIFLLSFSLNSYTLMLSHGQL